MPSEFGSIETEHGPVNFRSGGWRDLKSVGAVEEQCFADDSWPWIDMLAALTFPNTVRILAEVDGEVIGFVIGDRRIIGQIGWVASLGVSPDWRRKGVGMRLLELCEELLGTIRVRLTLRQSNHEARSLYHKAGYEEIGQKQRYYRDGEGGVIMERVFADL
jgi:ribosomal-protein-alanine N-acetyltransferase